MVHLILSSTKGNQGLRYFPHIGYLGLTPIRVEGVVRTKLDDDAKQLLAKSISISVRCYEARIGRVGVLHSNILVDFTQTLWSKPHDVDYAPIDNLEFPFRIHIPANVPGFSTAIFVDYRCMWRVEAVLNHVPLSGLGACQVKHFELPLLRFDLPPYLPPPLLPSRPIFRQHTTKPRAPTVRYCLYPPSSPIGPLDLISIPIFLAPVDDSVSIRSATVIIERRLQLNEVNGQSSPPHSPTNPSPPISQSCSPLHSFSPTSSYQELSALYNSTSIMSGSSSNSTITPHSIYPSSASLTSETHLLHSPQSHTSFPPSQTPSKIITTPIVGVESSGQFVRNEEGVWSKTLTLQWPAAKSHSRWAIGETIQSDLVSVKFFIRVKITVSSLHGTESLELSEQELLIVSTNEGERQIALSKYNELLNNLTPIQSARSKSKSPRRSRRNPELLDVPPPPTTLGKYKINSTGSITEESGRLSESKVAKPRRPHTSAGPRDKSFEFARSPEAVYRQEHDPSGSGAVASGRERPGTSQSETKRRSGMVSRGYSLFSSSPRIGTAVSASSAGTGSSASGNGSMSANTSRSTTSSLSSNASHEDDGDRMKEWEAELAKIEIQSRKSSDMLGFAGKRKRSTGASVVGKEI